MSTCLRSQRGFFLIELVTSIAILGVLFTSLALGLRGFADYNRYHLARQHCIAAAQAQLDSIALRGAPLPDEDIERLWPDVELTAAATDGSGPWQSLQLIQVTARGAVRKKSVVVTMSRYIEGTTSGHIEGTPQP